MEVDSQTDDDGHDEMHDASDVPKIVITSQCENVTANPCVNELTESAAVKCPTRTAAIKVRDKVKLGQSAKMNHEHAS